MSNDASSVVGKLRNFVEDSGGEFDRLIWVVATLEPLSDEQVSQLETVRRTGQSKMSADGPRFDAVAIDVKSLLESPEFPPFVLKGRFADMADDTWVGSVFLHDLYEFLRKYRSVTKDLDRIYEKNVRRWLGFRKTNRVNWGLKQTVEREPEKLGIYNNGITIVANRFERAGTDRWKLTMPYIVNGCQTTRTVFEVVDTKLGSGGTRPSASVAQFRDRLELCALAVKVVETSDEDVLRNITKYSNTQNAVRSRDLVALDSNYQRWRSEVEQRHGKFLEIQRGGWDSRKAFERKNPNASPRFTSTPNAQPINANDMIKVFGSGWLGYAGTAGRRAEDFLPPQGRIFQEIVELPDSEFGADAFVAAQLLSDLAKERQFGSRASGAPAQRRLTKFIFYYVFVELMRSIIVEPGGASTHKAVTDAILKLRPRPEVLGSLADNAAAVIDAYINENSPTTYTLDPGYRETRNLEGFLKSSRLDRKDIPQKAPRLVQAIAAGQSGMEMSYPGRPPLRRLYREALGL